MNVSFLTLPIEKQKNILDSAYYVFARHEYKKAPMSEIAAAGGISKSLLFYYFKNKQELYLYLFRSALVKLEEMNREVIHTDTTDFFEKIRCVLVSKCKLMKEHPYLQEFVTKAYYETEPETRKQIDKELNQLMQLKGKWLQENIDYTRFREKVDLTLLIQEIVWVSDGYMHQKLATRELDLDGMKQDFEHLINQWKNVYYC